MSIDDRPRDRAGLGDSGAKVPDSVLLQAVTSLHPATAAQIASLALPNAS